MKKILIVLCFIVLSVSLILSAQAETVSLTFTPPTTNEDGTPLTDLAGYTLYYQQTAGVDIMTSYKENIPDSNATGYILTVQAGHWCFVMTASDLTGNESANSNEICTDVLDTTAPATFIIEIVGN